MNTASIIQSRTSYDSPIRQTVVILVDGAPTVWTREGAGRGANGAWVSDLPNFDTTEQVVGNPKTVDLSDYDVQQVRNGIKPDSLLQRIVRKVSDQTAMIGIAVEPIFDTAYNGGAMPNTNIAPPVAPPVVVAPPAPPVAIEPVVQVVREPVRQTELVHAYSTLLHPMPTDPDIVSYITRTIAGVPEDKFYDSALRMGKNVWLGGHAGTGKSTSARRQASRRGVPFATVNCDPSMDESQIQGELVPTENGHFKWRNSPLVDAIQQRSVVLINEATRMSPKANSYFLSLLMEREIRMTRHLGEVIKVHPECLIIADGNWNYKGVAQPDEAFLDRYGIKVEFRYDRDIESKFIRSTSLLDVAFAIRDQYELGEFRSVFSTRVLKDFVDNATELGWEFARESLLNSMKPEDRGGIASTLDLNGSNICDELGIAFPVSV